MEPIDFSMALSPVIQTLLREMWQLSVNHTISSAISATLLITIYKTKTVIHCYSYYYQYSTLLKMKVRTAHALLAFTSVSAHLAFVAEGLPYPNVGNLPEPASEARHRLPIWSSSHINEWQFTCVGGKFFIRSYIYTTQADSPRSCKRGSVLSPLRDCLSGRWFCVTPSLDKQCQEPRFEDRRLSRVYKEARWLL